MLSDMFGIRYDLFSELKPFFAGMDLSEISLVSGYINRNNWNAYKEFACGCKNKRIKIFYENTADLVKKYMKGD